MIAYKVTVDGDVTRWYRDGKPHREDGPAIEYSNGTKYWYRDGKLHREDGPAAEYSDGYKAWYLEGERHREDGPAIESDDGTKHWYLDGKELTEKQHAASRCAGRTVTVDGIEYLLVLKQPCR